jgi:hypothetical protein
VNAAMWAVYLDPHVKLYQLQLERLLGQPPGDTTIRADTDLSAYALVSFGRYWPK